MASRDLQLGLFHMICQACPVLQSTPHISAIPVLSPTHEVEGRDVSVEICNKNQQRHPTVSGNERYKRHAGVTHYTSPTVVAPSVMPVQSGHRCHQAAGQNARSAYLTDS